eukprot:scaffold197419_cov22-Prasinocladus_malaysianus.AAC.2
MHFLWFSILYITTCQALEAHRRAMRLVKLETGIHLQQLYVVRLGKQIMCPSAYSTLHTKFGWANKLRRVSKLYATAGRYFVRASRHRAVEIDVCRSLA